MQKRGIHYQEGSDNRGSTYNDKEKEEMTYSDNNYSVAQLGKVKRDIRYQEGSSDNGNNINKDDDRIIYSKEYYLGQPQKLAKRGGLHQESSNDRRNKVNDKEMTYSEEYYKDHHFQIAKRTSNFYYNSHKQFKRGLSLNTAYRAEVMFDKRQIASSSISSAATTSSSLVPSSFFIFTIMLVVLYRITKH